MIVDAHQHFWKIDRRDYHWLSPSMTPLYRDYLPADLGPTLRRAGVARTVVVQAAPTVAETAFLLQVAAETEFVAGVVGWLDFEDPHFGASLAAFERHPKFVGVRPMIQDLDDDAWMLRPAVMAALARVADSGLAFDFLTFPRHLDNVRRVLERLPHLRGVIDHASKPPIATGAFSPWCEQLRGVAALPNVSCKLSGLVTEAKRGEWAPADLAPFIRHAVEVFGPKRVMFGSDWPVCLLAASYAEVLNALRTVVDPFLGVSEMDDVFGGNAVRFYRLADGPSPASATRSVE